VISVLDSVNVYDTDPNLKLKVSSGQCVLEMIDRLVDSNIVSVV